MEELEKARLVDVYLLGVCFQVIAITGNGEIRLPSLLDAVFRAPNLLDFPDDDFNTLKGLFVRALTSARLKELPDGGRTVSWRCINLADRLHESLAAASAGYKLLGINRVNAEVDYHVAAEEGKHVVANNSPAAARA